MRPFNPAPECEKCGGKDVNRAYHVADVFVKCGGFGSRMHGIDHEHHALHCRTCGFAWQEEVKPEAKP